MHPQDKDLAYIWDMRQASQEIIDFTKDVKLDAFVSNKILYRAIERQLEIIGEAARNISDTLRQQYPDIAWKQIIGLRNILAHEYGEVLMERIYRVATQRVPELLKQLDNIPLDLK